MGSIYLHKIDLNKYYDYAAFLEYLTPSKKQSITNYRFKQDKLFSVVGEALLRYGLMLEYGICNNIDIEYGRYQKPYLADYKIYYNISHSGDYVVCVLSVEEIGVDIEKHVLLEEEFNSIASYHFSRQEYRALQNEIDKKKFFYDLWTLKESYLKYRGIGLIEELSSIEFRITNGSILFRDLGEGKQQSIYFYQINIVPEYSFAVCSKSIPYNFTTNIVEYDVVDKILKYGVGSKEIFDT